VSARLQALRDDRVHAALLQPQRFVHRGGGCEDLCAGSAHACEQLRVGQAEMEAHDWRAELIEDVGSFSVKRHAARPGRDGGRVDAELLVVRRQLLAPARFDRFVRLRLRVAEEVHVEGLAGGGLDRRDLLAYPVGRQHRARQRAQPSCIRYGDRKRTALHARHRRLDDRQFDSQHLLQAHVRLPGRFTCSV
jgi:hypothetical protein